MITFKFVGGGTRWKLTTPLETDTIAEGRDDIDSGRVRLWDDRGQVGQDVRGAIPSRYYRPGESG